MWNLSLFIYFTCMRNPPPNNVIIHSLKSNIWWPEQTLFQFRLDNSLVLLSCYGGVADVSPFCSRCATAFSGRLSGCWIVITATFPSTTRLCSTCPSPSCPRRWRASRFTPWMVNTASPQLWRLFEIHNNVFILVSHLWAYVRPSQWHRLLFSLHTPWFYWWTALSSFNENC